MGEIIIHHKGVYNIYSTMSDGVKFEDGITKEELEEYIKEEHGRQGLKDLPARIERSERMGTSEFNAEGLEDTIFCNRAGKDESKLSMSEFIDQFLTIKEDENDYEDEEDEDKYDIEFSGTIKVIAKTFEDADNAARKFLRKLENSVDFEFNEIKSIRSKHRGER